MTAEITPAQADLALAAAGAAAQVLPAAEPLTAAGAQAGTEHVTSAFSGAAVADLEPAGTGRIGVLVAADLVEALASSPLGGLDLAAATQPALDAAAAALNLTASAAREVDLGLVVSDLGEFTAVPLVGTGFAAAVLISNDALVGDADVPVHASVDVASAPAPAAMATPPLSPVAAGPVVAMQPRGIEMLHGVDMEVTVELGRTRMTVRDLLALAPGTVLELDRAAGSPADLLVNGRLIARGEVVVLDEDFGLRVTEIVDEAAAI
jgi:flagellar motor switch protein FliN/FliY